MTLPNPEHYFDQAAQLVVARSGPPRQVDLRRAISSAYYGLFHAIVTDAADKIVGRGQRGNSLYALAYRQVDHRRVRGLCVALLEGKLQDRYKPYVPAESVDSDLIAVAETVIELQDKRERSDYDPRYQLTASEAQLSVSRGRASLEHWRRVPDEWRQSFALLLLFPPRDRR